MHITNLKTLSPSRTSGRSRILWFGVLLIALFAWSNTAFAQRATAEEDEVNSATLADVIVANDEYSMLEAALERVGMLETLDDPSASFTFFAPTNEAFERLPDGLLNELMEQENMPRLLDVLRYHLVPASATSAGNPLNLQDLEPLAQLETLNSEGGYLLINDATKGVTVNYAAIVDADNDTSNGMLHAVDRVLLPQSEEDRR